MDYSEFLQTTLKESAQIALNYFGQVDPITKPEDNNQVLTEADLAIAKHIVEKIKTTYPSHNIIDEETGAIDNNSNLTWVIDPIEATSNFASGSEQYGIMIGLLEDDKPVAGGIILPAYDVLYLAEKGKGATKNGHTIKVSSETDLTKVLVSYGIDAYPNDPEITRNEIKSVAEIVLNIRNLRNSGCEALDAMYVAEGIYGGRVNRTGKIWDNVAPQIIVEESGGLWTSIDGTAIDYSDPTTKFNDNFTNCAASPQLHDKLVKLANSF